MNLQGNSDATFSQNINSDTDYITNTTDLSEHDYCWQNLKAIDPNELISGNLNQFEECLMRSEDILYIPQFSLFSNKYDIRNAKYVNLLDIIELIKSNKLENITNEIRNARACGDHVLKAMLKAKLPYFTHSGIFNPRKNIGFLQPSFTYQLDIDNIENPEELLNAIANDNNLNLLFATKSTSGNGIKGLLFLQEMIFIKHSWTMEEYRDAYKQATDILSLHFLEKYKVKIDCQMKAISQPFFLFHDSNIFINTRKYKMGVSGLSKCLLAIKLNSNNKKMNKMHGQSLETIINRVCKEKMHYNDFTKAIGTLVSVHNISYDTLIEHHTIFTKYISSESETLKNKSPLEILTEMKKSYNGQKGSFSIRNESFIFSQEVYSYLPKALQDVCSQMQDPIKRDIVLISLITAASAIFTRYRFYHGSGMDVKEYSPHILTLIIGQSGSGKGLTRYGKMLTDSLQRKSQDMRLTALEDHKKNEQEYLISMRKNFGIPTSKPPKPAKISFLFPADTTQAALVEILKDNPIGGLVFDSELDCLTQANGKKEFGGFSDIIRKAFHHEPLGRNRLGEGESYEVEAPRMATLLSATEDQVRKLILSEYNGLFSRFLFYKIQRHFIEYVKPNMQEDIIGGEIIKLSTLLCEKANPWEKELTYLKFTDNQEARLEAEMLDKKDIEEQFGGDIGASWLRLALIVKRIAVTLAAIQNTGPGTVPDNCFQAAIEMLSVLKKHSLSTLDLIRQNQGKKDVNWDEYLKLKEEGYSDTEIAKMLGVSRSTLARRKK